MAIYTALSLEQARTLGARFGLEIEGLKGLAAGTVNTSYELRLASSGRAFLRICEAYPAEVAARQIELIDFLAKRGVPTPRPLPLLDEEGAFVAFHQEKPVVIFPWCEGDIICQRGVTAAHTFAVGEALARLHVAGLLFETRLESRFRPEDLVALVSGLKERSGLPEEVTLVLPELGARLEHKLASKPGPDVPVIHADLFRDNVLWFEGKLAALLDFEAASYGSAAFDLAVTLLSWCYGDELDLDLARALVQGYSSRRSMPEEERETFYDEALFAAVRFAITRITDVELVPRGLGVYKDFRRFVKRLRAIEEIGRSSWRSALGV